MTFSAGTTSTDGGLSKHTVRAKLAGLEVACDVTTRAPLYNHETATTVLATATPDQRGPPRPSAHNGPSWHEQAGGANPVYGVV